MSRQRAECSISEGRFSDWYDNLLPSQVMQSLNRHIATCQICQQRVEDYNRMRQQLRQHHTRIPQERVWRGVRARVLPQPLVPRPRRFLWGSLVTLLVAIVIIVLSVQVLRPRPSSHITTTPGISDTQAWGNYPRLTSTLPNLAGSLFIPTSLSPDGAYVGGYAVATDGQSLQAGIVALATMTMQPIGAFPITSSDRSLVAWVGQDNALIMNQDHQLLASYERATNVLVDHRADQAIVRAADLGGMSVANGASGIVIEEIATTNGHNALQILDLSLGTHATIASDVVPSVGLIESSILYGQAQGPTARLYNASTHTSQTLPSSVADMLFTPTNTFVTNGLTAFFTKPEAASHTEALGEISDFALPLPTTLVMATALPQTAQIVAATANNRFVLFNDQGRFFIWDEVQKRDVQLPADFHQANVAGGWLWLANGNQITRIDTNHLPFH